MAEISLRPELSELAALAEFIERFAEEEALSAEISFHLNLVLEELVTNAITHGHAGSATGAIELRLERDGDILQIDLVDQGDAFDPRTAPEPDLDVPLEERSVGGLGVHLVRRLVDEIDYRREAGRNHLRLRKRVKLGPESDEEDHRG